MILILRFQTLNNILEVLQALPALPDDPNLGEPLSVEYEIQRKKIQMRRKWSEYYPQLEKQLKRESNASNVYVCVWVHIT